jgi:hypothetical protein
VQLRVRLSIAIAATGLLTSFAVAVAVRGALVAEERRRFEDRVASALGDVPRAIKRAEAADRAAVDRVCANDPAIDRAIAAAHARADLDRRSATDPDAALLMVQAAQARAATAAASARLGATLGIEQIWIVDARDGFILAAPSSERAAVGATDARKLRLATDPSPLVHIVAANESAAVVARCAREERGEAVLVTALRPLDRAFFDRISDEVRGVRILASGDATRPDEVARPLSLDLGPGPSDEPSVKPPPLQLVVGVSGAGLASAHLDFLRRLRRLHGRAKARLAPRRAREGGAQRRRRDRCAGRGARVGRSRGVGLGLQRDARGARSDASQVARRRARRCMARGRASHRA